MKYIFYVLMLQILNISVFAESYTDRTKSFFQKKKPCVLAFQEKETLKLDVSDAYCFSEGIYAKNTMNEVKGCFLTRYSATHNRYESLVYSYEFEYLVGPICTKEAIQSVLNISAKSIYARGNITFFSPYKHLYDAKGFVVLEDELAILGDGPISIRESK